MMLADPAEVKARRGRKAVAGIFIAMLLFAMLFTVGFAYFTLLSAESAAGASATATSQNAEQHVAGEQLSLSASLGSSPYSFILTAYNTGGVSSTISAVYVENNVGQLVSKSSTGSPYLVNSNDLGLTLPLELGVGEDTHYMTCATTSGTCDIPIKTTACPASSCGGTVYIYVLTADGNSFDVECNTAYTTCQSPLVTTTSTTITGSTTSHASTSTVVSSTTTSQASTTTILTSSSTGNGGLAAGTNSLLLLLTACAGPGAGQTQVLTCPANTYTAYQGGEVLLTATIENFSPDAMSVYASLVYAYTNSVSVTPDSSLGTTYDCSSSTSTVSVPAATGSVPGTATIYCTYTANQGASGGTATFIGYAVGSYTLGAGQIEITSAESTSNAQQIGNFAASITGPWSINYNSFYYQSDQETSLTQLAVISASGNSYVSFQVVVTNTANSSLTVLGYSYLLVGRIAQEMDFYLVQSTSYSGTPTATAWNCQPDTPSAPETSGGAACSSSDTVAVGASTTLTFAACYPEVANFEWQDTGGGNPGSGSCGGSNGNNDGGFAAPEGVTMFVDVVYAQELSGTWYTFSQTLPFYGVFVD